MFMYLLQLLFIYYVFHVEMELVSIYVYLFIYYAKFGPSDQGVTPRKPEKVGEWHWPVRYREVLEE